jgi:hypothetical protein
VSREGVLLIKSFEGFRPRAMQRSDGRWVIGYGHTQSAREGARVSEAEAELLMQYDLIPVVQAVTQGQSAVTIIYKEFGVKLSFTPTILDEDHIRLELEPEVSSLDITAAIQLSGFTIPGLRVRRAKTTLELRNGQSFALAGLIDNSEQVNLAKFPLLGDIPLIGELFKSRSFRRNETELLFLATVKIVEPLNPDQLPRLPGVSDTPTGAPTPGASGPVTPDGKIEGQSGHAGPRRPDNVQALPSTPVVTPPKESTAASETRPPAAILGPVGPDKPLPGTNGQKRPE